MPRFFKLYVDDMLGATESAREFVAGIDFDSFIRDERTRDAVLYNLTVLGEAASRVPQSVRERAPDIAWRKVVGLRNIIVHDYFGINDSIVWDVVQNWLPPLIVACRQLLELPDA